MNIFEICKKELFREMESDEGIVVNPANELRNPTNQDYYRFLLRICEAAPRPKANAEVSSPK
jgi:hypothetical protein